MSSYKNFTSKNKKHTKDRTNIYEPAFNSPIESGGTKDIIKDNIAKWAEFCSFIR